MCDKQTEDGRTDFIIANATLHYVAQSKIQILMLFHINHTRQYSNYLFLNY